MSKKTVSIIGIIVLIIVVIGGIVYLSFDKKGVAQTDSKEEKIIKKKKDDLYDLPEKIDIEETIRSGYVVLTYNKIYNKNVLDRFIENTKFDNEDRVDDSIILIQFTVEGDPIITQIEYVSNEINSENESYFIIRKDNTRDEFAAKEDRKITENRNLPGAIYGALLQEEGDNLKFGIAVCAIIDRSDDRRYKTIDICEFEKNIEEKSKYVKYENVSFVLNKIEFTEKFGETELLVKNNNSKEFEKVIFIKTEEMKKENEVYAVDIPKYEDGKYTVNGHIVENANEEPGIRAYKFESEDGRIFRVVEPIMVQ